MVTMIASIVLVPSLEVTGTRKVIRPARNCSIVKVVSTVPDHSVPIPPWQPSEVLRASLKATDTCTVITSGQPSTVSRLWVLVRHRSAGAMLNRAPETETEKYRR